MSRVVDKSVKKPFVALRPVPVVLVSCGHGERANIITIAWTGILCSNPPQVGIGVQPPVPSWGNILTAGKANIEIAWWLSVFPGLAITALVISLALIGDGLQQSSSASA